MKLAEVAQTFFVERDNQAALDREIEFFGPGWYSLDDDGVYRKGRAATFSRIRIKAARCVDKIEANRIRESRRDKAERILRRVRQRVFDYEDAGNLEKAQRVIGRCQSILAPRWEARRIAAQNDQLQRTPSLFEPGSR